MSNPNTYKLVVGWRDRKIFRQPHKLSRAEAWLSLVEMSAAEKILPPVRQLMTDWNWTQGNVQRFLCDLEAEGLILRGTNNREKYLAPSDIYQTSAQADWYKQIGDLVQQNCPETLGFEDDSEGQLVQPAHYIEDLDSYSRPKDSNACAKKYRYEGEVIKLNERDYDKMRSTYSAIPDFDSALATIDIGMAAEKKHKGWYVALTKKLNYQQQLAKQRKSERGGGGVEQIDKWKPF
tara:strand:- start:236 stop:940 length:705 start_codon:yes stop_codon:yes gene_type:complete